MSKYCLYLFQNCYIIICVILNIVLDYTMMMAFSRKIFIGVCRSTLHGEQRVPHGAHAVQLLQHGVHVARGARVLQPHQPRRRPRAHARHVLPLRQRHALVAVEHVVEQRGERGHVGHAAVHQRQQQVRGGRGGARRAAQRRHRLHTRDPRAPRLAARHAAPRPRVRPQELRRYLLNQS
ncbi:unnamed protein product [Chrysodeixis includens]|uniref:Uncharacterized protein n=1 Tax=Chrysodeixis includens TaxID=689277 RepID=A0A9N8PZF8_CHRIL|nr:unnamed protein product [Chrysodeixis includens]